MNTYDRGTNEYYGDEDEVEMSVSDRQQAQDEAHQHFVIQDFSNLVLELGPNAIISKLSQEAHDELMFAFSLRYDAYVKDRFLIDSLPSRFDKHVNPIKENK